MSIKKQRKTFFQTEREVMKDLTFPQKLLYLWDYYKFYFLGLVLAIVVVVGLCSAIAKGKDAYDVTCLVPEDYYSETTSYFSEASASIFPKAKDNRIQQLYSDHSTQTAAGTAYAKLSIMIFSAQLDVMICDESTYEYVSTNEIMGDLTQYIPADVLAKYEDYFVYADYADGQVLCALDISSSTYAQAFDHPTDEPLYLTIAGNTGRQEEAVALFEYIAQGIQ